MSPLTDNTQRLIPDAGQASIALIGHCSYRIQGGQVTLQVQEIANNRPLDNQSGTVSLELWALPTPYAGDRFSGTPMAAARIGELLGQHCMRDCSFEVTLQPPPAGQWVLTLMLREWEADGYVTRDYVNFPETFAVADGADTEADRGLETGNEMPGSTPPPHGTDPVGSASTPAPEGWLARLFANIRRLF